MKALLFFSSFICMAASVSTLSAQTTAQIGTGNQAPQTNNSIYSPICRFNANSSNDCSRSNLLYTSTELNNAGITQGSVISKIAFYKIGTGASTAGFAFEIHMRNSTATAPLSTATTWATILTTHTPVYTTTTQTIPATSGWIEFTLTNPFTYTGQNLEIAMSHNMVAIAGNPSTGPFDWEYTNGFQDYIIGIVGSSPPATLNGTVLNYKVRPNIQITYTSTLPITLVSFKGEKQGSANKLAWETATEINSAGFELQRSSDGIIFAPLDFVKAHGERHNSNETNHYSFVDTKPAPGTNYYRLKQIDRDGSFEFSEVIAVKGDRINKLQLISVYPNPVKDVLNIKLETPVTQKATMIICDAAGKVLIRQSVRLAEGESTFDLPVSVLASGNYFVKIMCTDGCETSMYPFLKK